MGTTSPRWAFVLPDPADTVDIVQINNDMLKIDDALGFTPCTTSTRPSNPSTGQVIYETDTHRTYVYDASGVWQPVGSITAAVATAAVANAVVTLAPVPDLVLPVNANSKYVLEGFLAYSSATTADAQFGLNLPSGSSLLLTGDNQLPAASGTSGSIESGVITSGALQLGGAGVGVTLSAAVRGTITVGGAAGNVQGTWAQISPISSDTVLAAGSWLSLRRI